MAVRGANRHIRSSLGFSILPKDTLTCRPGESNQQPSDNNTLVLPQLSLCRQANVFRLIIGLSQTSCDPADIMWEKWMSSDDFTRGWNTQTSTDESNMILNELWKESTSQIHWTALMWLYCTYSVHLCGYHVDQCIDLAASMRQTCISPVFSSCSVASCRYVHLFCGRYTEWMLKGGLCDEALIRWYSPLLAEETW